MFTSWVRKEIYFLFGRTSNYLFFWEIFFFIFISNYQLGEAVKVCKFSSKGKVWEDFIWWKWILCILISENEAIIYYVISFHIYIYIKPNCSKMHEKCFYEYQEILRHVLIIWINLNSKLIILLLFLSEIYINNDKYATKQELFLGE